MQPVLMLVFGLAVLLAGGYAVVEGASSASRRLGVSRLAVGLTVVAFGTSAPELAVNLTAAIEADPGIAFGNIVGSNIANIGLILGLAAILRALSIRSRLIVREIPMLLLATAAASAMALDPLLTGRRSEFDRVDGLLLLLFFAVFLRGVVRDVRVREQKDDPLAHASAESRPFSPRWKLAASVAFCLLGFAALAFGADFTVRGAEGIARSLGVPAAVVGVSIVAVGTSLPELVTSVIAAGRGDADIAVGNIVGSNLFNLLFILGLTSTVAPVPAPPGSLIDFVAMGLLTLLLAPFSITHGRTLTRAKGVALLTIWAAYMALRFALAPHTSGMP